jgi:hypothetical protein
MFTCHLDTACKSKSKVNHVHDGNFIRTDGQTILGADDKAGMIIVLYMIENKIPGLYYFFIGEEVGCIGSGKLAKIWNDTDFSKYITKVVSFDRRGTDSIITEQLFGRSCSNQFAIELSNRLNSTGLGFNFSPDPTGIYTDSAEFMPLVQECTNISVGYYKEHTTSECQDIEFLKRLCKGVCLINWEDLPISRDPSKSGYYGLYDDDDDDDFFNEIPLEWDQDNFAYFSIDNTQKKMYISKKQIDEEKSIIYQWLSRSGDYSSINDVIWNGRTLYVNCDVIEYVGERHDIINFLSDLKTVPISQIKEKI